MRIFRFLMVAGLVGAGAFAADLASAVKAGDKTTVAALIQQHADVNAAEPDGTTPLMWAVRQSFTKDDAGIADLLIRAGANVKAANRYGVNSLFLACQNGNAYLVEQLLKAGADPNAGATENETALMTAARAGALDAAKILLDHGAQTDARENWHGETALMFA